MYTNKLYRPHSFSQEVQASCRQSPILYSSLLPDLRPNSNPPISRHITSNYLQKHIEMAQFSIIQWFSSWGSIPSWKTMFAFQDGFFFAQFTIMYAQRTTTTTWVWDQKSPRPKESLKPSFWHKQQPPAMKGQSCAAAIKLVKPGKFD